MKTLTFALMLACAVARAAEPSVWRCGTEGRSYSDSPCPGGQLVAVADPRSELQRAEARDAVRKDQAIARQLVQERQQREAYLRARGPGLIAIKPVTAPRSESLKPRQKAKEKEKAPRPDRASRPEARGTSPTAGRASPPRQG